jgi:hypothetical protein
MSLFDMLKDKATELFQGTKEQVSDLTGVEVPVDQVVEQAGQATDGVTEAGQNLAETATGAVTDAGQSATDAVTGVTDPLTGK